MPITWTPTDFDPNSPTHGRSLKPRTIDIQNTSPWIQPSKEPEDYIEIKGKAEDVEGAFANMSAKQLRYYDLLKAKNPEMPEAELLHRLNGSNLWEGMKDE